MTGAIFILLFSGAVCDGAIPVESGEVTTCAGVLIPDAWARDFIKARDVDLPRCEAEKETQAKRAEVKLKLCQDERAALAKALRDTDRELVKAEQAKPDPWYRKPELWFAVGVALGAVSVGAAGR
jgi:hypothetical protein